MKKKIQELIESIFSYNKDIKQSIIKYDEIDKKNKNNFYSNENIKVLINKIYRWKENILMKKIIK